MTPPATCPQLRTGETITAPGDSQRSGNDWKTLPSFPWLRAPREMSLSLCIPTLDARIPLSTGSSWEFLHREREEDAERQKKKGIQPFQGRAGLLHPVIPTASAFLELFSTQIIPFPSDSAHMEQELCPGAPSQLSKECGFLILCSVHLGRIGV